MLTASRVTVTCALLLSGCSARRSADFRVVPGQPEYFLRYPDAHESPFSDMLRVYNGYERGSSYIDLRPFMELRVENAYYRPGASRRGLDGFIGTEVARYKVRGRGGLQLLSIQSMKNRPADALPVEELVPGSAERFRYQRFFYEIFFRGSRESRGSALVGSDRLTDLTRLTAELQRDPNAVCHAGSNNCAVFPEACSVSVEMEVVVNGKSRSLVWGSNVASVAEHPRSLDLRRNFDGRLIPVRLDTGDPNALLLPLLPGDRLTWK